MPERLESICAELAAQGLGVQGVADGAPYQHLLEGCTSVLVFASGGTGLLRQLACLAAAARAVAIRRLRTIRTCK